MGAAGGRNARELTSDQSDDDYSGDGTAPDSDCDDGTHRGGHVRVGRMTSGGSYLSSDGESSARGSISAATAASVISPDAALRFATVVYKCRCFLVIFWPLVTCLCLPLAAVFPNRVIPIDMDAPVGTESAVASQVLADHFGTLMQARTETVLISCTEGVQCDTVVSDLTHGFVEQLTGVVQRFNLDHPGTILRTQSYFTYGTDLDPNPLLSRDRRSMLFQWTWRIPLDLTKDAAHFCDRMNGVIAEINAFQVGATGALTLGATGPTFLKRAVKSVLFEEIILHDLSLIPFSMGVLALRLGNLRQLIFPLASLMMVVPLTFFCCYWYSLTTLVVSYAPTMVWLLGVALALDYSLFMLTRYAEERAGGADVEEAIIVMLVSSGQVVVLSGSVLMVAYAAMLFLPGSVKSISFSSCCTILFSMLLQLLFVPALLAVCPWLGPPKGPSTEAFMFGDDDMDSELLRNGSSQKVSFALGTKRESDAQREFSLTSEFPKSISGGSTPRGDRFDSPMIRARPHMSGLWFKFGAFLTRFPLNVIVPMLLYALLLPLTYKVLTWEPAHGFTMEVPQHRPEWALTQRIAEDFIGDVGCFFPIFIIMVANRTDPSVSGPNTTGMLDIRNQHFFEANCKMVDRLIDTSEGTPYALDANAFRSVTFHEAMPSGDSVACDNYANGQWYRSFWLTRNNVNAQLSGQLMDALVSDQHDAIITILYPRVDAFSDAGFALVSMIREQLTEQTRIDKSLQGPTRGVTFLTHSFTGVNMDTISVMMGRLPLAFAGCAIFSFFVIAASFRALFIPLKLFFTIILPITWTYGFAICVYENGWLTWTGADGLSPIGDGGLMWAAPVYTLTIMLGLALDYDIFLFSRIWEYKKEGFGDREAIQLGLAATGPIITTAGCIFAITFSGLLASSIPLSNQIGFLFSSSMILDTFVVRTILVPAMLSLWPRLNYWPAQMPKVVYRWHPAGE